MPRSSNGILEIYIDNELFNKSKVAPIIYLNNFNLNLGKHQLKLLYYNDTYYNPINKTFEFNVNEAVISIPKLINISHDDCISVTTEKNTQGTVKVYLDSKLINIGKIESGYYVFSLEKYLTINSQEVKVIIQTSNFTQSKTQLINITYDFDAYIPKLIYGEENIIEISLPDYLNNKLLNIEINGTKYPFKRSTTVNNIVELNVSKLNQGNYSMFISYNGDNKFIAKNKTLTFLVDYDIIIPYDVIYKDNSKIYLRVPSDMNGNLVVYIDGKLFKIAKLNKGYAEVKIDNLKPGIHEINASFDGDYNITHTSNVYTSAKITTTHYFRYSEDKYVTLEVPKDTKGYVIFEIDGKKHKVTLKNGIARYSLKNIKVGEHDIYVDYYGSDGFKDLSNWLVIKVSPAKIKLSLKKISVKKSSKKILLKATLKINGKSVKGKVIKFKFMKKTFKAKTNKKGIAKVVIKNNIIKKLKINKKITYQVSYAKKTVKHRTKVKI